MISEAKDIPLVCHSLFAFFFFSGRFPRDFYCCLYREERRDFIRAKYEQHKYAIITCTDKEDLKQDLKQAVLAKDLLSLLQVYAEGLDLATTLPYMVRNMVCLLDLDR